jgi:hypothetical protein
MKFIILLFPLLYSCGTAKTVYADSKYKLCQDACSLKYSKYENTKLYECLNKCREKKKEDVEF